jgi:hypothetical protein
MSVQPRSSASPYEKLKEIKDAVRTGNSKDADGGKITKEGFIKLRRGS